MGLVYYYVLWFGVNQGDPVETRGNKTKAEFDGHWCFGMFLCKIYIWFNFNELIICKFVISLIQHEFHARMNNNVSCNSFSIIGSRSSIPFVLTWGVDSLSLSLIVILFLGNGQLPCSQSRSISCMDLGNLSIIPGEGGWLLKKKEKEKKE